jgi:hypothetical protein
VLTFFLVFCIFTTAFELIPKAPSRISYKAQDKGLTLYTVTPQV